MHLPIELNQNVLFVGAGGGFDIFGALPILSDKSGVNFVLANYSHYVKDIEYKETSRENYPEGTLDVCYPKYSLGREGVQSVKRALNSIIAKHNIQQIISVDCGVDSLFHGDEDQHGTILEETITMTAISLIPNVNKIHVCVGFGTENEENLNHFRCLENISSLIKDNAFYGTSTLLKSDKAFNLYKECCETAWKNGRISHIHPKIIAAVEGGFGSSPPELVSSGDALLANKSENLPFINPLMALYWFFDLMTIVKRNRLSEIIKSSNTFVDVKILLKSMPFFNKRSKEILPL